MAQESGRPHAVLRFWSRVVRRVDTIPVFRAILVGLLLLLGIVFLTVMCSDNPSWALDLLGTKELERSKYETLKFLGLAMGGILVALQALMSYRRANAMEDRVSTSEQGQQHERLKNAIEHLGNKKQSVRLGGAYELFHLAKEGEELNDMVLDILCAHIRRTTAKRKYQRRYRTNPSEEIQSLLRLVFVQDYEPLDSSYADLQGAWLNGAQLGGARLHGADLESAYLKGANLVQASLQGASLDKAQLQMAFLVRAHLEGVSFEQANLQGAYLDCAHLQGASLVEAQVQGASVGEADLRGVRSNDPPVDYSEIAREVTASSGFQEVMRDSIGLKTDVSGAVLNGGLSKSAIESSTENLSEDTAKELRKLLKPHIAMPDSAELPEDSSVRVGTYNRAEADEWITAYERQVDERHGHPAS